ncbi:MAG: preprotein translocase subunit SecE [Malacoplasma sp.]
MKKEENLTKPAEVVVKQKKQKKPKKNYGESFRRFFFGVGKEFKRISWISKKEMFNNFFIVVFLIVIFALIFTGISILMINIL